MVCHDILGQTALVDLAGLRDAIADKARRPGPGQPGGAGWESIVDHPLAVERGGYDPEAFAKNRAIEDRRNEDRFHFIDWTKQACNVDVIPPGNGIMHQINLEKMSPVIQARDGVAFPIPAWAPTAIPCTSSDARPGRTLTVASAAWKRKT